MPQYIYKAKSGPGKTVEGHLNAESKDAAMAALDAMGYSPISIEEKEAKAEQTAGRLMRRRIGNRDVTVFTRQLSSLIKSGVPILKALSTVGSQTENLRFRSVLRDLEATIRDGGMLSTALAKYPRLFSELYVNMVKSGESAGKLDTILLRLSEAREKDDETRRKVQAATAYPALIVVVGLATVFVLLSFFLPRVVVLFKDYRDLPMPTRILISVSNFFSANWPWILAFFVLAGAIFKRMASAQKGLLWLHRMQIRCPVVGKFIVESELARFARTLALLIESGIPIDRALGLSRDTLRNMVLRNEVELARKSTVLQGLPLSVGVAKSVYFPPFVGNMMAVGEESGRLDEALNEIATYYEQDVEQQARLATSLLEPILILCVGAVVGFIVAAMLLPIFRLGTSM